MDECAAAAVTEAITVEIDAEQVIVGSDNMVTDSGDVVPQGSGGEDPADPRTSVSNCGGNGLRRAHLDQDFRRMHTPCAPSE